MSEEQLKAFLEKVKGDTSLQEKLKAEGVDPVAIAKAAGFSISTEDLNTHRQNLSDPSDIELESMAGGGGCGKASISWWDCGETLLACASIGKTTWENCS